MLQVKVPDSPFKVLFQISYGNDKALHLLRSCSTYVKLKVILNRSFQTLLISDNGIIQLHDQIYLGKFTFYSFFFQFNFAVFELAQKELRIAVIIAMYHR